MLKTNNTIANEAIVDTKLLVINNSGENLGVLTREAALKLAKDADLDLVLINSSADGKKPSVAKIIDIGKYLFELKIKQKNTKHSVQRVKELTVKPQIAHNDLATHARKVISWVNAGHQVQFKISARGRIGFMPEMIQKIYDDFVLLLNNEAKVVVPFKKFSPVLYGATIGKK